MEYPYNLHGGQGFRTSLDEAIRLSYSYSEGDGIGRIGLDHDSRSNGIAPSWLQNLSYPQDSDKNNSNRIINSAANPADGSLSHKNIPVVDYATFKQKLRNYGRCRDKLRRLLEDTNTTIATEQLQEQNCGSIGNGKVRDSVFVDDMEAILAELLTINKNNLDSRIITSFENPYVSMGDNEQQSSPSNNARKESSNVSNIGSLRSCDLPGLWRSDRKRKTIKRRNVLRRASNIERDDLTGFLAGESRKIYAYYDSSLRSLQGRVIKWIKRRQLLDDNALFSQSSEKRRNTMQSAGSTGIGTMNNANRNSSAISAHLQETIALGRDLLDLQAFCAMNILVVRQILIRYDAFTRSVEGTPLMEFYLKQVLHSKNNTRRSIGREAESQNRDSNSDNKYHWELQQILSHHGISSLCEKFYSQLLLGGKTMGDKNITNIGSNHYEFESDREQQRYDTIISVITERFQSDREQLSRIVLSLSIEKTVSLANVELSDTTTHSTRTISLSIPQSPASTSTPSANTNASKTITDTLIEMVQRYSWCGMYMEDQIGWTTADRGRTLTEEMRSLSKWKRQSQMVWSKTDADMFVEAVEQANALVAAGEDGQRRLGFAACLNLECDNLAGCGNDNEELRISTAGEGGGAIHLALSSDQDADMDVDTAGSSTIDDNHSFVTDDGGDELTGQQKFNLVMALGGGFLYCMNYYIVEPSSTMYVNALGAQDAAGAILIGMMPIACFLAAIVYSVWTNTVYRQPFLVSCSLMVMGNIVYSSAFNYQSLPMALVGRFMTGLGGPKMIVRRYIADTTSSGIRTSVNALFGMVVAAGSALGPCCAILLSNFDFIVVLPGGKSEIWFNSMTGPGWFMAFLWGIFSAILFYGFREEERIGLKEKLQQDNEESLIEGQGENKKPKDIVEEGNKDDSLWTELKRACKYLLFPVQICMGLLFGKVFVIETLVSCTSALSKNRYGWTIHEVGALGCFNGFFVIPISILVGKLSMYYQDRYLMVCLLLVGISGLSLLVDVSDLVDGNSERTYNKNTWWSVGPTQYVIGYFVTYVSIQSFEGIIGSALSKLIPTALAQGTFNSGLLATLVDTSGRGCGDIFISLMGFLNIRQLMNLLFIPGLFILVTCLTVVRRNYDVLAV
ncbi:unnamed protein product [Pseudo-nitzschia multistriata]|uniref:SPX domain-containing protein n=1 Tax=Pseudo-nitzschia multistriata TaxID=183589 RepID=A0A448ZGF4_9STRA|nr:unnamed protein product [Pseudo-nitzschia multistriata]